MLIVSPKPFNILGIPLVCPITQGGNFARHAGFAVPLSGAGTETQGVVLCNQSRVLDLQARKARFVERVPEFIIDEVLAKLIAARSLYGGRRNLPRRAQPRWLSARPTSALNWGFCNRSTEATTEP